MTNYDDLSPAELADEAPDGPEWAAWRAAHPAEAAEIEVGRRVRALLMRLQAAEVSVPAGFEARLLERVRADKTLLDLLDLGLAGIGRSVIELLNLIFGLLPERDGSSAALPT